MPVDLMYGLPPDTVSDVTSHSTCVQQLQSKLTAVCTKMSRYNKDDRKKIMIREFMVNHIR